MNPIPDDALGKIKKLLRVGEGRGSTEAEVEQAMQAALRLSQRYGINIDEIDAAEDIEPPEPIVSEDFKPERTGGGTCVSKLPTSNRFVVMILEEFFRVKIIYITEWGTYDSKGETKRGPMKHLQLFGKKTNVQIAMYVYGFLHREFNLLWNAYRKKTRCELSSRSGYYYGLYDGLRSKLSETMGEVEDEVNAELDMNRVNKDGKAPSMALILKDEQESIDAKVKEEHPRLKYLKDPTISNDIDAIYAGRKAGKEIEIKTTLKEES